VTSLEFENELHVVFEYTFVCLL